MAEPSAVEAYHGRYKPALGHKATTVTARARRDVRALLQQVSDDIDALPRETLRELVGPLREAQKELEQDLARWLKQAPDGAQRFTAHQYRGFLRQIREAQKAIKALDPSLVSALKSGNVKAAGLSSQWLTKEIARLSQVFGEVRNIDFPLVTRVLDKNSWLIPRFERSAARYTAQAQDALRRQFAIGVTRGETFDQLTERIMRLDKRPRSFRGLAGGKEKVVDHMASGIFRGNVANAQRLVRTEMMNAYNAHHAASFEEASKEIGEPLKKRWDASADSRRCVMCREVDGEVVEQDEVFSFGGMHPPRHPNCRCVVIPWMSHWPEITPLPQQPDPEKRLARKEAANLRAAGVKRPRGGTRAR
jgi:SPP1 gp7 family putative phage head morphogenesis protein